MLSVRKTVLSAAAATFVLVGAKSAMASGGVVFIHGTGDHAGQLVCSGANCAVSAAATGYWSAGEISSVANGRPYVVVGYAGGACAPWPAGSSNGLTGGPGITDPYWLNDCSGTSNNTTYTVNGGASTALSLTGGSGYGNNESNADIVAAQIAEFLAFNKNVTELTLVTHSGGSNQARFIMQNYSRNANYTKIHSITKRVATIAAVTNGTYLANEVFSGAVTNFIGGLIGYKGEGTNFIRTNYMATYNTSSSYLGPVTNPVQGVTFYSTGGVSSTFCAGVKIGSTCVGGTLPTLGGSSCGSYATDLELLSLHDVYLSGSSNPGTNGCSDGFIPCLSSQALGHTFSYSTKQDHNQSRQQCNNLDVAVRGYATGDGLPSGFSYADLTAGQVPPTQIDACGFSVAAPVVNSGGTTVGYTEGCPASNLGNGICDWDCIALYGHDAAPTWSGTAGKSTVTAWGSADDCTNSAQNTTSTYDGTTYLATTENVWGESNQNQNTYSVPYINTYLNSSGNAYYTSFTGQTCNSTGSCNYSCGSASGTACAWYTDPNYATTSSAGYCPPSWFNDGNCDECMLATAGGDGTDCLPSQVTWCGGIQTQYQPNVGTTWSYYDNPVYNELNPSSPSSGYQGWSPMPASGGDGICESSECGASVTYVGTADCVTTSDCPSGYSCQNGGCTSTATGAAADCTATYNLPPRTCATNADCNGNACGAAGTCTITGGTCTTDANCPAPTGATSSCSSGVCSCTTSADCSGGAACTSSVCATSVTASLCR
jgi:hypothetical protein